jgi:hypothetical protein
MKMMQANRAFWRAIHSLAHPVTIFAVLMLLFNDHWWRHNYPSWLTGKMGDFTWLVFAPIICALLVAWVVPHKWQNQEKIVGWLSFGFIGVWFATAKTMPVIHQITTNTVEWIVGWEGTLRIDPTDLLTLPALLIGYYIWHNADNRSLNLRPMAYIVLGLGIMATLASVDSDGTYTRSYYTTCINIDGAKLALHMNAYYDSILGNRILHEKTHNYSFQYISNDGGISWYISDDRNDFSCIPNDLPLVDPNNPDIQYRYQSGNKIEQSIDTGQAWAVIHDLSEIRQQVRLYYHANKTSNYSMLEMYDTNPGPYDAVIHEPTGNIIFAMGWDGILVYKSNSTWEWVAADQFYLDDLNRWDKVYDFLAGEIILSVTLFFLVVTTSTWYIRPPGLETFFIGIGWIGWLFLLWGFVQIYIYPSHLINSGFLALLLLAFIAIPVTIGTIWDLLRNFLRYIPVIISVALITALLFLFPYVLWTQGTIPAYSTARGFALLLTACSLLGGGIYLRRILPFVPDKRQLDDRWRPVLPIRPEEFFHRDDEDANGGE